MKNTLDIPFGISSPTPLEGKPLKVSIVSICVEIYNNTYFKAMVVTDGEVQIKLYRDVSWTNEDLMNHVEQRQDKYQELLNYKKD